MAAIDWASVNWIYVGVLAVFALFSTLVGNLVSFGNRSAAAIVSALVFAGIFVMYSYYPHHLPLPTSLNAPTPTVATKPVVPAPTPPAAPTPVPNPVQTITPPAAPK